MSGLKITGICIDGTSFKNDLRDLPEEVRKQVGERLKLFLANPNAGSLRMHDLNGHLPKIWKIDITSGKGKRYQATFHLVGSVAVFLRIGTHKQIDRSPN